MARDPHLPRPRGFPRSLRKDPSVHRLLPPAAGAAFLGGSQPGQGTPGSSRPPGALPAPGRQGRRGWRSHWPSRAQAEGGAGLAADAAPAWERSAAPRAAGTRRGGRVVMGPSPGPEGRPSPQPWDQWAPLPHLITCRPPPPGRSGEPPHGQCGDGPRPGCLCRVAGAGLCGGTGLGAGLWDGAPDTPTGAARRCWEQPGREPRRPGHQGAGRGCERPTDGREPVRMRGVEPGRGSASAPH